MCMQVAKMDAMFCSPGLGFGDGDGAGSSTPGDGQGLGTEGARASTIQPSARHIVAHVFCTVLPGCDLRSRIASGLNMCKQMWRHFKLYVLTRVGLG